MGKMAGRRAKQARGTQEHPTKLLFVCSRNRRRSLTAEKLLEGVPGYDARSAGTQPEARIVVTEGHIGWADIIFPMEKSHLAKLRRRFPEAIAGKQVVVLHIPDDYDFMDAELLDELRAKLAPFVALPAESDAAAKILPLARRIIELRADLRAMGYFDHSRELLDCAQCGLEEDVTPDGLLITTTREDRDHDSTLRFIELPSGMWKCPQCGQENREPESEC